MKVSVLHTQELKIFNVYLYKAFTADKDEKYDFDQISN